METFTIIHLEKKKKTPHKTSCTSYCSEPLLWHSLYSAYSLFMCIVFSNLINMGILVNWTKKAFSAKGPLLSPWQSPKERVLRFRLQCVFWEISVLLGLDCVALLLLHNNKESRRVWENCEVGHELKVLGRGSLKKQKEKRKKIRLEIEFLCMVFIYIEASGGLYALVHIADVNMRRQTN